MTEKIQEPQNRLAKDVIRVMYIESIIWLLIQALVIGVLFFLDHYYEWNRWVSLALIIVTIIAIINKVVDLILPIFRYRNWRYGVDTSYLYLKHGAIFETRQLIPMTKIQSVETEQGPLLRRYNLYTVSVATMGTSHSIPGLPKDTAFALRDEIARYAKIKEEEE